MGIRAVQGRFAGGDGYDRRADPGDHEWVAGDLAAHQGGQAAADRHFQGRTHAAGARHPDHFRTRRQGIRVRHVAGRDGADYDDGSGGRAPGDADGADRQPARREGAIE
ncbi:hypothetical protein G6F62_014737 [Rhizopus arrhizus]|nr:hypothetical protein G6F62_014737 [Rhizopus arrhizus]